jgi:DNA repair protein RadD
MVDEAHELHEFYHSWMGSEAWQKVPFVGLTATPWTKGLGKLYDDLGHSDHERRSLSRRFLSKFKVFAPSHPDLRGVKTVAGDYHEGQLSGGNV